MVELGYSTLTRRERLERIAMAERDRRAGRIEVAIAALGDALEWPARAVLALARLPEFEAEETRRILEEGLDHWAREAGLEAFDVSLEMPESDLDRPIDHGELERAFEEAEAQTDEMVGANDVAERILMDEPVGLAELDGDEILAAEESHALEIDAAEVVPVASIPFASATDSVEGPASENGQSLATLERWLRNLEDMQARRAQ